VLFPAFTKNQLEKLEISLTGLVTEAPVLPNPLSVQTHPHAHKVPLVFTAAVCAVPADTIHQLVAEQNSCIGLHADVVLPFPNFPDVLSPQLQRLPLVLIAVPQLDVVLHPPTDTIHQSAAEHFSLIGLQLVLFTPMPSAPLVLPHTHKELSVLIAADENPSRLAAIAHQLVAEHFSLIGLQLLTAPARPSPKFPQQPNPQAQILPSVLRAIEKRLPPATLVQLVAEHIS
jgi:hypothetical protein